jgi:hypothetical protein
MIGQFGLVIIFRPSLIMAPTMPSLEVKLREKMISLNYETWICTLSVGFESRIKSGFSMRSRGEIVVDSMEPEGRVKGAGER